MTGRSDEFVRALRAGEPKAVAAADRLLRAMAQRGERDLTGREVQVLELMASGLRRDEIASRLFLSPHTVKDHWRRGIAVALGARTPPHAVALWLAREAGVT